MTLTVKAAAEKWVGRFNAINQGIIARLMKYEPDKWCEVTVPVIGDSVYIPKVDVHGEIIECNSQSGDYRVRLTDGAKVFVRADNFKVEYIDILPMWSTMWSFDESIDDWWLEHCGGIESMSQLGFRIYEHDEFGYYFGIDGGGYDFYEEHWIPLYKARGLEWHKLDGGDTE